MIFSLIIGLIVAIIAIVVALQNAVPVTVIFFAWEFTASLALIILVAFAAGIIMSLLISVPGLIRRGMRASHHQRKHEALESEKEHLLLAVEALKKEGKEKTQEIEKLKTNGSTPEAEHIE